MKSNVPWSVKGIDPEARVAAKEAARKAGMTLGEWITHMINEQSLENESPTAPEPAAGQRPTGVMPEQLRAVVDSLNRLNERLKNAEESLKRTEEKSREAMGGLNQGLETVFERIKRVERARNDVQNAVGVVEAQTSATPETRERLESLKALERALTQMIDQFETSRQDTIARVAENEAAVGALNQRVDLLDRKISAGFQEVHDALDAVGNQLDHTERTAKAVLLEAKDAATSTDAEFVERTGKKLQLLGNEIKRSGDQISAVEQMMSALSQKIEAAEQRSAQGIAAVAKDLNGLRDDIVPTIKANDDADAGLRAAAAAAEETVSSLQRSYDDMIARMEGRLAAMEQMTPEMGVGIEEDYRAPAPSAGASLLTSAVEPRVSAVADPDVARVPPVSPQDAMRAAMSTLQSGADPRFGEAVPNLASDPDAEFDAVFGETSFAPPMEPVVTADAALSPRDKILAAARARKERAEREKALESTDASAKKPLEEALTTPAAHTVGGTLGDVQQREGQNRKLGLPLLALLGVGVLAAAGGAALFFRGGNDAPSQPAAIPAVNTPSQTSEPAIDTAPPAVATAVDSTPDGRQLYQDAKALLDMATTDDDLVRAFAIMREAAIYGHVPAQFRLGEMYFSGVGTDQNFREAKRWFESAAMSGNAIAMHRLGSLAIDPGDNSPPKYDLALDWFARAANYGVVDSMYNLGFLFDPASDLLPAELRDAEKAYRHYMLAASRGDEQAQIDAASVATRLSPSVISSLDAEVAQFTPLPVDPRVNDGLSIPK